MLPLKDESKLLSLKVSWILTVSVIVLISPVLGLNTFNAFFLASFEVKNKSGDDVWVAPYMVSPKEGLELFILDIFFNGMRLSFTG